MYEAEIAYLGFIISCREATGAFELVEGTFDLVSQGVDVVIATTNGSKNIHSLSVIKPRTIIASAKAILNQNSTAL